ncbi:MAG TPA: TonB-dependent receptor [Thermoanaerobaculia bacterium]
MTRQRAALFAALCGLLAAAPVRAAQVQPDELRKMSIEELMEVDVTSVSRRSERVSGAAAAVTVITGEDIRRSGVTSLPEALRLVDALHVARFNSGTWAISARGFNVGTANKLLVLIDGRSVYTPLFAGVFWDVQDLLLDDVDRIEVIRGPGATLWGANAVNGVINVITKSARATPGGLAKLGAGNEEGFAGVRYGGALGERAAYRVYTKYRSIDALAFAAGGSAEDPLRALQGGFRVDGDRSERDSYTLQGDVYRTTSGLFQHEDSRMNGGNVLGHWSRRFDAGTRLDLRAYWDRTFRRVPGQFEEHRDTWDVDFQHTLPFGRRHEVVWGLGYRVSSDDTEDTPVIAWVPGERTQTLFSAFAQDEIALVPDRVQLTVGSKLEVPEYTGLEVQPSVRLAWTPNEHRTLWGAVSRAVRAPTRLDEDSRFLFGPVVLVQGSRDFESEEVIAYEAGYRILPRSDVSLEISTFYNVYDHLRSQEPPATGAPFPITLANGLNATTYGAEMQLNVQAAPWWRLYGAYTWFHSRFTRDPDSRDPTGGASEGDDPGNRFAIRSYVDLPRGVELDAWLRYVDSLPNPFIPSYTELDLRLGWRPSDRLELSLVGQNLLHERHAEFFTARPEEVQRGVFGRAVWRF